MESKIPLKDCHFLQSETHQKSGITLNAQDIDAIASRIVEKLEEKKNNKDLISLRAAYKLRGRARVRALIEHGCLKYISSGSYSNSIKYVSKKKLLSLDNLIL